MDAHCYLCKKKINHGEDYTSINKGIYSMEGDKDWIALIFHDVCWGKFGKMTIGKIVPIFMVKG